MWRLIQPSLTGLIFLGPHTRHLRTCDKSPVHGVPGYSQSRLTALSRRTVCSLLIAGAKAPVFLPLLRGPLGPSSTVLRTSMVLQTSRFHEHHDSKRIAEEIAHYSLDSMDLTQAQDAIRRLHCAPLAQEGSGQGDGEKDFKFSRKSSGADPSDLVEAARIMRGSYGSAFGMAGGRKLPRSIERKKRTGRSRCAFGRLTVAVRTAASQQIATGEKSRSRRLGSECW
jgi:hypothetical protein